MTESTESNAGSRIGYKVNFFRPQDILERRPLLKRVVRDVIRTTETRRKSEERLEELVVISRKFSSSELQETIDNLRNRVAECRRNIEDAIARRSSESAIGTTRPRTEGIEPLKGPVTFWWCFCVPNGPNSHLIG